MTERGPIEKIYERHIKGRLFYDEEANGLGVKVSEVTICDSFDADDICRRNGSAR